MANRPHQTPPDRNGDDTGSPTGVRLQRVLAEAGVASRRECEQMILDGRVEVNGELVTTLPAFVNPSTDRITVDGRQIPRRQAGSSGGDRVYVMLNKPDNTLAATRDELEYKKGGRRTVNDIVQHPTGARLFPVGRLDYHSTGLVLMTNDGKLADRLTHAKYGVTKTYRIWITNDISPDTIEMLRRRVGKRDAVDEQGNPTGGVRIMADEPGRRRADVGADAPRHATVLEIEVREGKTEPLDEMLTAVGCRIKRIARTKIGPLELRGVGPGEWRDLFPDELEALFEAAGLDPRNASRLQSRRRTLNSVSKGGHKPASKPRSASSRGGPSQDRRGAGNRAGKSFGPRSGPSSGTRRGPGSPDRRGGKERRR